MKLKLQNKINENNLGVSLWGQLVQIFSEAIRYNLFASKAGKKACLSADKDFRFYPLRNTAAKHQLINKFFINEYI